MEKEKGKVKNILVRGRPGSGKTTLAVSLVDSLSRRGFKVAGLVTEEIREGKSRRGFKVRDLNGEEAVLAHVDFAEGPRVGKYGVDVAAFEGIALRALRKGLEEADLLIIDEIGKMESLSPAFRQLVMEIFENPVCVLATLPAGDDPFLLSLLQREDVSVWSVEVFNRDRLREVIEGELLEILGRG